MCEESWETDKELLLFFTKWLTATYCEPGTLPSGCLQWIYFIGIYCLEREGIHQSLKSSLPLPVTLSPGLMESDETLVTFNCCPLRSSLSPTPAADT